MSEMQPETQSDELSTLLREFRDACPDGEPSINFTPAVWRGIAARRKSGAILRRWAEVCLVATAALALLLTLVVIPRFQNPQTETNAFVDNYVDVLRAADPVNEVSLLPGTETAVEPVRELE